jgi:hypothetical protein
MGTAVVLESEAEVGRIGRTAFTIRALWPPEVRGIISNHLSYVNGARRGFRQVCDIPDENVPF